jgi:hypothetical protein
MSSIQSPADSCEVGGDGAVAGEAGEGERVGDVADDVGEAADGRNGLDERAHVLSIRRRGRFGLPAQDGAG